MDFKQTLIDNGWKFYRLCHCNGTATHKFRKLKEEIFVMPNRSSFSKYLNGRIQLKEKLLNLSNHV